MDDKLVIASSLLDNDLAKAFSRMVAERWDNWDLSPFMVYLVDICDSSVLPYLADQFDIEGLSGFEVASNDDERRELIKRSIALHKFIGTPWAIREACKTVGFPVIELNEGVTVGEPTDHDWAQFSVFVLLAENKSITQNDYRKLKLFIEFYKNERSHLVELGYFVSPFEDDIQFTGRDKVRISAQTEVALLDEYVFNNPVEERSELFISCEDELHLIDDCFLSEQLTITISKT